MTTAWEADSMLKLIIGSVQGGFHKVQQILPNEMR
jgi:hypothetical protein